jgi:protein-S-isoprenylcysteine O-methyltransferase Ste14
VRPEGGRLAAREYSALIVKTVVTLIVMAGVVFLFAGSLAYRQGWVFVGLTAAQVVFSFCLLSGMPDLVRERMRPGPGTKQWDAVLVAVYSLVSLLLIPFSAADAGRLHLSPVIPAWGYAAGWALFVASYGLSTWSMRVNRWFSIIVRIQTDRGQRVVSDGPYRVVRHPGYVGGIGGALATPVILGSLWGLAGSGIAILLLVLRTWLEDRTLIKELPGYADYTKKVKWRLVPGVW